MSGAVGFVTPAPTPTPTATPSDTVTATPTATPTVTDTATPTAPPSDPVTVVPLDAATFQSSMDSIGDYLTLFIWIGGVLIFFLAIIAVMAVRK